MTIKPLDFILNHMIFHFQVHDKLLTNIRMKAKKINLLEIDFFLNKKLVIINVYSMVISDICLYQPFIPYSPRNATPRHATFIIILC